MGMQDELICRTDRLCVGGEGLCAGGRSGPVFYIHCGVLFGSVSIDRTYFKGVVKY